MVDGLGTLLIGLSLAVALYAAYAAWRGMQLSAVPASTAQGETWLQSAQNATNALAALLGAALLILLLAFLTDHFAISYVARHSSTVIPVYLKISAVWAGQEGSLLLWCFLQALFAALATGRASEHARPLVPWATVFLSLITAFFVAVTLFLSPPFALLASPPLDGRGLNPLLRHPGMIFHPPALYVGYVGLAIPFAFAVAALITRQIKGWTAAIRTWTLIAWLGLGLGLLLGMRWAYDVLGWGGYWGWDPVENAGLLPWLTATGLLHAAVMQDEKRGFHGWTILLAIFSFVLVLFGTFATRSGMIQSVHAYTTSNLGGYFLTAILVTLMGSLGLLYARRAALAEATDAESLGSRDGMFFLTLVLLSMLTLSIFMGSILPTFTEALTGRRFEAGPAWFDRVTGPQFAVLVLVLGLCPLLGRGAATLYRLQKRRWIIIGGAVVVPIAAALVGFTDPVSLIGFAIGGFAGAATLAEFVEGVITRCGRSNEAPLNALWHLLRSQRRKYGGYLVHLGVILMALGVIGTRMYPFEAQITVTANQPTTVGDYTLIFEELKRDFAADFVTTWANVAVYRDGAYLATLQPRLNTYSDAQQTIAVPALHPGLREDFYLILSGWSTNGATATFKVVVNALVNFLWLGGLVFLAGGALALWPTADNAIRNTVALIVGLALLLGAGWAMWGIPHGAARYGAGRPLVGQVAPDFHLRLLDGGTVALEDLRGAIVVVNLWASWCPSCVDEMPDLQAVWEAYRDQDVLFLGVAYRDEEAAARDAIVQYGTTYPVGLDTGSRIAKPYGITGVPETFVIAADGRVAHIHIGPVTGETLAAELEALLEQPQAP